ncbi:hypothetical protein KKC31_02195 [Patescibacteria group bacterium]|nr:hypothetical protein [Patescibacteria group bacterium]
MRLKTFFTKSAAAFMTLALSLSLVPGSLHAEEPALIDAGTAVSADEDVVVSSSDEPLERQAKLKRAWVVYREKDDSHIYAITKDKQKREIQTLSFFTAFNANYHVLVVAPGRLSSFTAGDPITSTDGLKAEDFHKAPFRCRLVKVAGNSAVYLVCFGKKRLVIREGVFHRFGWEFRDVETVTQAELDAMATETDVDETTVFEEEIAVEKSAQRQLRNQLKERLNLRGKAKVRDRLVKAIGRPEVYVITPDGKRHHIKDLTAVRKHNLNLKDVTEVTIDELEAYEEGSEISSTSSATILNQNVNISTE